MIPLPILIISLAQELSMLHIQRGVIFFKKGMPLKSGSNWFTTFSTRNKFIGGTSNVAFREPEHTTTCELVGTSGKF